MKGTMRHVASKSSIMNQLRSILVPKGQGHGVATQEDKELCSTGHLERNTDIQCTKARLKSK